MDTQGFVAGSLSALCIVALVMGTASAAVITAADGTSGSDTGPVHQHPSPDSIITSLEQRRVDVTEAKTAIQNGDPEAVRAWPEASIQAHRPERPERAGRSPPDLSDPIREQQMIDRLEKEGVDVTGVEADLLNGDTTAVQAWLETYLPSHEGETGFHHPHEHVNQAGTGE
jgi:hypothetical protein